MQSRGAEPDRSGRPGGVALAILTVAVTLLALFASGCGSGEQESGSTTAAESTAAGGGATDSTAGADIAGADPGDVEVISGWIGALSDGDVEAAAGYFAIPSSVENISILDRIRSTDDAIEFNRALPCGGEVVAAETTGDFTTATFELTERPGGDCGTGTGGEASTSFVIENGRITDWRRVANPGDEPAAPAAGAEVS